LKKEKAGPVEVGSLSTPLGGGPEGGTLKKFMEIFFELIILPNSISPFGASSSLGLKLVDSIG
jgi:hypothetical protein